MGQQADCGSNAHSSKPEHRAATNPGSNAFRSKPTEELEKWKGRWVTALVGKVHVGSFGAAGDAIKLKEKSLNMMQISQNTIEDSLDMLGDSIKLMKDDWNTVKHS